MTFGDAVQHLRAGAAVRSAAADRVLVAVDGDRFRDALNCTVFFQPADIFADDWEIVSR